MISEYQGPTPTDRFIQSVLLDYSEGDHEFERELITSYITSVEEHLPELSKAFEDKNTKDAILHSHDIKGSSSYIGAEAVRYLSGKIEAYCKFDQLQEAESFFPELKTEVEEVIKVLNDYMDSWGEEATTEKDSTTTEDNKESLSEQLPQSSSSSSSPTEINKDQQDKSKTDKIATETVSQNNNNNNNNSTNSSKNNIENDNKLNEKISNNNQNNSTTKIDS
ncbi:hypothetical protein DICPUDRAFT_92856 [Dictyostelium purpureum]|uniref:HPt domain-containing protein n=1 Tax=Dictyostelium purpureum TaxID=5786 RepID=F0ZY80_DICPU|nr:uncharacterized protein DICPUDRAFT_92856 [Dictyostelium purpureum]EGC31102.1 hypothetical protein DICPUDRAFT_92856 [Dictyostelium purpureum]|eukprot:XP_003292379.1 hypothetical protein DICPUDRAFT_92856 [Dictyostelium purpureum]